MARCGFERRWRRSGFSSCFVFSKSLFFSSPFFAWGFSFGVFRGRTEGREGLGCSLLESRPKAWGGGFLYKFHPPFKNHSTPNFLHAVLPRGVLLQLARNVWDLGRRFAHGERGGGK